MLMTLTEVQSTIVRTTLSDYTYDIIVKQVKAIYSESKQKQSEEIVNVKVEDIVINYWIERI